MVGWLNSFFFFFFFFFNLWILVIFVVGWSICFEYKGFLFWQPSLIYLSVYLLKKMKWKESSFVFFKLVVPFLKEKGNLSKQCSSSI